MTKALKLVSFSEPVVGLSAILLQFNGEGRAVRLSTDNLTTMR